MTVLTQMILNDQAHNRFLPDEHLRKLTTLEVLRNTHPMDRVDFATKLHNLGKITDFEFDQVKKEYHKWKTLKNYD